MSNEIINAITTVGFPIIACIAIAWYAKYTNDNYRADMKEANMQHKEEIAKITDALNNNTIALQKLCDVVDK